LPGLCLIKINFCTVCLDYLSPSSSQTASSSGKVVVLVVFWVLLIRQQPICTHPSFFLPQPIFLIASNYNKLQLVCVSVCLYNRVECKIA
jgi:hypothetical protein